jgi:uncharacterized protein (TIGR02421 family)
MVNTFGHECQHLTHHKNDGEKQTMPKSKNLSDTHIKQLLKHLKTAEGKFDRRLPGGGFLHVESGLPYLIVYRKKNKDVGTRELVLGEACYLVVGRKNLKGYQDLLCALAKQFSAKYKAYLILEVSSGDVESTEFVIKGPAEQVPKTLKALKKGLQPINALSPGTQITTRITDTLDRHPKGRRRLLTPEQTKRFGILLLGLSIPPVYRNKNNQLYPVFFRGFHHCFTKALQQAVFDFIRIQTVCGVRSYTNLGQRYPKEKVFEIDRQLAETEASYQFLWLVSPSNIYHIKKTFMDSGHTRLLDYHYRLLPIDPDVVKRRLYALKIEKVEDPVLSFIFRQKREELDHQITMLNERGTSNFFYNSIRLHRGIGRELQQEAEHILKHLPEQGPEEDDNGILDAYQFAALAKKEFAYLKAQSSSFSCKVHIRDDVNIMMVSHGELYVPSDFEVGPKEAEALIQHEIGTHVLTHFNGRQQPFRLLSIGLADYDTLQEGLAVFSEFVVGGLTTNRLRTLAGRVLAGKARLEGQKFKSIFNLLMNVHGFSAGRAFNITSRIMQGGGLLKDIMYLKGLLKLRAYIQQGGELKALLSGKFGFHHIEIIQQLTERNVLRPPVLTPRYLDHKDFETKIEQIKKGLPISEMACDKTLETM